MHNGDYNYDTTLADVYPVHRKIAQTEDVLEGLHASPPAQATKSENRYPRRRVASPPAAAIKKKPGRGVGG